MTDFQALLGALRGIPRLDGALCVGNHHTFDLPDANADEAEAAYRERTALNLCQECPALNKCAAWLDSLPCKDKPEGVVAGKVIRPAERRGAA